jgi:hypothetical protein
MPIAIGGEGIKQSVKFENAITAARLIAILPLGGAHFSWPAYDLTP